jgi:hypothetical protein
MEGRRFRVQLTTGQVMTEPRATVQCDLGFRCESCGVAGPGLSVKVYDVLSETMCLTVCERCRSSDRPPSVMLSTAQRLVEQHRQHLAGLDRPCGVPEPDTFAEQE